MVRSDSTLDATRIFEWIVVATAIVSLAVHVLLDADSGNAVYLLYLALTALSAYFGVGLPSATGSVPLGFIFVLAALFVEGQHFTLFHGLSLQMHSGITSSVAATMRPVLNVSPSEDPIEHRNPVAAQCLKSAMIIPLDGPNGLVGTLNLYAARHMAFHHSQLSLLLSIASKLAISIENSAKFQQAETRALVDFLTGLPNAGALFLHMQNELARCARTDTTLGLIVFDLDGFKGINDQFGHLTGNRLLQLVAQGLRENCREYDFVARMGGDEFVMVLPGVTPEAVDHRLRRLRNYVERCGMELCGNCALSLSGGAAYFPEDGRTAEELIACADKRMYGEKKDRKQAGKDVPPAAREATA